MFVCTTIAALIRLSGLLSSSFTFFLSAYPLPLIPPHPSPSLAPACPTDLTASLQAEAGKDGADPITTNPTASEALGSAATSDRALAPHRVVYVDIKQPLDEIHLKVQRFWWIANQLQNDQLSASEAQALANRVSPPRRQIETIQRTLDANKQEIEQLLASRFELKHQTEMERWIDLHSMSVLRSDHRGEGGEKHVVGAEK